MHIEDWNANKAVNDLALKQGLVKTLGVSLEHIGEVVVSAGSVIAAVMVKTEKSEEDIFRDLNDALSTGTNLFEGSVLEAQTIDPPVVKQVFVACSIMQVIFFLGIAV